tara:strand:- start:3664 stop:4146 length:483 start_codon:yes stop_codon:yes gene_type:complete
MAYFAELNLDNVVLNMEVIDDANCSIDGVVNEAKGAEFLNNIHGKSSTWKSYEPDMLGNVNLQGGNVFRKNAASIGGTYDSTRDAFIDVKPFNSWSLDETTCLWKAPVDEPSYEKTLYNSGAAKYLIYWDEDNFRWLATGSSDEQTYIWNPGSETFSLFT